MQIVLNSKKIYVHFGHTSRRATKFVPLTSTDEHRMLLHFPSSTIGAHLLLTTRTRPSSSSIFQFPAMSLFVSAPFFTLPFLFFWTCGHWRILVASLHPSFPLARALRVEVEMVTRLFRGDAVSCWPTILLYLFRFIRRIPNMNLNRLYLRPRTWCHKHSKMKFSYLKFFLVAFDIAWLVAPSSESCTWLWRFILKEETMSIFGSLVEHCS